MRTKTILPVTLTVVAMVALATPQQAEAAMPSMQCVTYARDASGLNLKGDAWRWWDAAAGVYERGRAPREGSVLVFKRQGRMSHGHVSVVRRVVNGRELLVDHANWAPHRSPGRGQVARAVPVVDVSPNNDWSQVRVFYRPVGELGSRVYQTQGFVYRPGSGGHRAPMTHHAALAPTESAPMVRVETVSVEPVRIEPERPVAPTPAATPAPAPVTRTVVLPAVQPAVVAPPAAPAPMPVRAADPGRVDVSRWAEQA